MWIPDMFACDKISLDLLGLRQAVYQRKFGGQLNTLNNTNCTSCVKSRENGASVLYEVMA
jgi:hypothetical protein